MAEEKIIFKAYKYIIDFGGDDVYFTAYFDEPLEKIIGRMNTEHGMAISVDKFFINIEKIILFKFDKVVDVYINEYNRISEAKK